MNKHYLTIEINKKKTGRKLEIEKIAGLTFNEMSVFKKDLIENEKVENKRIKNI